MKKQSKILTLTLVLALIISAVVAVGIVASAEDSTPVLPTIKSKNLYFETNTQIAVQVTCADEYVGELGIAVYLSDGVEALDSFDAAAVTPVHTSFKLETLNGDQFYLTQPIPANDMSYPYIIVPVIKNGEDMTYGEPQFYSVLQYAYDKLVEGSTTPALAEFCISIMKYSASAEGVLGANGGDAKFGYAQAVGGTVGGLGYTFGGVTGDTVVLRANPTNSDGQYFLNWTNEAGEVISTERVAHVTITKTSGAEVYTANYGELAESAYTASEILDFEDEMVAMYDLSKGFPSWLAFSTGPNYPVGVIQEASGNKAAFITKPSGTSGMKVRFIPTGDFTTSAEADISYSNLQNSVTQALILRMNDNDEAYELRVNICYQKTTGTAYFYAEGHGQDYSVENGGAIFDENGELVELKMYANHTITFKLELVDRTSIRLYADGVLLGSMPVSAFNTYTFSENTKIQDFRVYSLASAVSNITVDNVIFN